MSRIDLKKQISAYLESDKNQTMSKLSKIGKKINYYIKYLAINIRILLRNTRRNLISLPPIKKMPSIIYKKFISFIKNLPHLIRQTPYFVKKTIKIVKRKLPLLIRYVKKHKNEIAIFTTALPVAAIWSILLYKVVFSPKPANIHNSKKDSSYYFTGKSRLYQVNIGDKNTNEPKVEFSLSKDGEKNLVFYPASGNTRRDKPEEKGNKITFKDVYGNTDITYTPIKNGVKEEIIVRKANQISVYPFYLELKGVDLNSITNISNGIFYDASGNYLFHFEKRFAVDAKGKRTNDVSISVKKDPSNDKLIAILTVDKNWINSSERAYPITIDPTVVHDTSSEFATGQLNRITDIGSGSNPVLPTYYQELSTDPYTVALWHMNEGTDNTCSGGQDVCDKSGNGNHASFNGNATFASSPIMGSYATTYDGNGDFIDTANINPGNNAPFTAEAWVYLPSNNANFNGIVGHGYYSSGSYGWVLVAARTTNNTPSFWTETGGYLDSPVALNLNQWYHIAGVYNGSAKYLYIDGQLVASSSSGNGYTGTASPYGTGRFYTSGYSDYYLNGKVDEVRISNIARTPEEIKMSASRRPYGVYTSPVMDLTYVSTFDSLSWNASGSATTDGETATGSATANLVAQWNFNEASGTTADNAQGTAALDGTLTNFASTGARDEAAGTGWTYVNRRWGDAALMFDGSNDYVSLPTTGGADTKGSNLGFADTDNFTLELWYKGTDTAQNSDWGKALIGRDSGDIYANLVLRSGYVEYIHYNGSWLHNIKSTTMVADGNWHHIVYVNYSNETGDLYIDGIKQISALSSSIDNASRYFKADNLMRGYSGSYTSGTLDSVRIYSSTLTPAEVLSNYNSSRIELQTRVGETADPNDGTWEAWKPSTSETAIDSMDTNANRWNTDGYQNSFSTISKIGTINTGTGNDGDCIMNNGTKTLDSTVGSSVCNDSVRSTAYAVNFSDTTLENAGETSVTVSTTPTGLVAGDEIIIINLQGTSTNYDRVGQYETHIISSISTNTLNFTDYPLQNMYDGTTQKIMVQRVPNFANVTVCGGNTGSGCTVAATLTTSVWDGTKGGILFFRSTGTVEVKSSGTIDVSSKGFRGGTGGAGCNYPWPTNAGDHGESINGQNAIAVCNRDANVIGNLVAVSPNLGGGGGGGGSTSGARNGGGGGGGSYAIPGSNGTNSSSGENGASSGSVYGSMELQRVFAGSGGGGGGEAVNACGGTGGIGGGIIMISANTLTNSGSIYAKGGNGTTPCSSDDGGGGAGGGAGGSIQIKGNTLTLGSATILASGGSGSNGTSATYGTGGNGGAGGSGRVALYFATSVSGSTTPVAFSQKLQSTIKSEGTGAIQISTGTPQVDSGTAGLWHLDETNSSGNGVLKDSTGTSANSLTIKSGTTITEGTSGKGRLFNGSSDYLCSDTNADGTCDTNSNLAFSAGFSVSFWIKTTSTGLQDVMVYNPSGTTNEWAYYFRINNPSNTIFFDVVQWGVADHLATSTTAVNDGKWHYVVGTRGTDNYARIYVDGVAQGTGSGASGAITTGQFIVGTYTTNWFAGSLDEIKISNVARTAEEIAEEYRAGRDHRISETITSTDLSTSTKLPFYVASDRLGTFMQMTYGESAFVNYETDSNTVGFWHLDEAAGSGAYIKDSSGNGNHGTPNGTTFIQGKVGRGRSFNGSSDYITKTSPTGLPTGSTMTAEAWIRPTGTYGDSTWNGIVGWGARSGTGSTFVMALQNTGRLSVATWGNDFTPSTGPTIVTNTWNHVAAVLSGTSINLYINGSLAASGTLGSTPNVQAGTLAIGETDVNGRYFNGSIDEVRISNTARTADQIRQAYEIGSRTHNITIDFKAKLGAGNLIADSSDKTFTVDETSYGSTYMASHLFLGDKIIIKENYSGTEYLAQGTVNAVNMSTGAVGVVSWDAGSTFPSSGFTANATVFKWQREYFDLTGSFSIYKDAVTRLTYRITDGSAGANIWLDDIKSTTGYLSSPLGSTVTSSTGNRYFQYRVIESTNDPGVSASLTSVTLDYTSNSTPFEPDLDNSYQADKVKTHDTTPEFRFSSADYEAEDLVYNIEFDTDSSFPAPTSKVSDTDSGFANVTTPADTSPFNSEDVVSYTPTSEFTDDITYFYRVRAKDPTGSNSYSEWSSIKSFTIDTSIHAKEWYETHADQFATDTIISGTISSTSDSGSATFDAMEFSSDTLAQAAYVTNTLSATGGTVTNSSGYRIHTFTSSGTLTVTNSGTADVLAVGGGGNGGSSDADDCNGGGGGGGEVKYQTSVSVSSSQSVTVGGAASNSSLGSLVSASGGQSGYSGCIAGASGNGHSGGSGSGGGGGDSENGYYAVAGAKGGDGTANSISGSSTYYGGGGGGGAWDGSSGGLGGGGNGGMWYGSRVGYPGTANTGGGGGGGLSVADLGYVSGGAGGTGIVIVKYPYPNLLSYSESTIKTEGTYSLKVYAKATTTLNKTLTKTLSTHINLSEKDSLTFDIRASRTGSNIKVAIHDSGGTATDVTPNITTADTFQEATIDLSGVSNANKDDIDSVIVTVVNADSDNTFYLDNFQYSASVLDDYITLTQEKTTVDAMEYSSTSSAQTAYVSSQAQNLGSGGTISYYGNYAIHKFTSSGTLVLNYPVTSDYLVVGAGGAGGQGDNLSGGGGGAGGLIHAENSALASGSYPIVVGPSSSQNSSFNSLTAYGGGYGWGGSGGSGGGGGTPSGGGGSGTAGQGNNGGYGAGYAGGGGGGAGGSGNPAANNWVGGEGGAGYASSISGSSVTYATGGRGGNDGAYYGSAGAANTGNGGGGGGSTGAPAAGGSGIVIVRYLLEDILRSYSEASIKTAGSFSLKVFAKGTYSLNKTLTRTISTPIDLSDNISLKFDLRSSRTGSNIKIGIHDSGGTTTEITPNVSTADTFASYTMDLSEVTNANKDAIDQIIITIVNADSDNTFYLDNMQGLEARGSVVSTPITASYIYGASHWREFYFTTTDVDDNLVFHIYYDDDGTPTIIPDSDLPGNSDGFASSRVDIYALTTSSYPVIYLVADLLSDEAASSPKLNEWGVTLGSPPEIPSLDSPEDEAVDQYILPTLKTTTTDDDNDYIRYKIELCKDVHMSAFCQTFDQTSSQTGWSGQDAEGGTAYVSGTQGVYTVQNALDWGTTYYWRSYAIDPGGTDTWGDTQASPYSFTTYYQPESATYCKIEEALDDSSLTISWIDNASIETGYEIQRSIDGGAFSVYITGLAANSLSTIDSSISDGHTYQYRIAPYYTSYPIYADWCTTAQLSLQLGTFSIKGLDLKGLILR